MLQGLKRDQQTPKKKLIHFPSYVKIMDNNNKTCPGCLHKKLHIILISQFTGRRIAELEMDTFVARLIENFQVEWFGPPPKTVQQALNYIKGPYNFVFKDIK